jgi:hypothetical protein
MARTKAALRNTPATVTLDAVNIITDKLNELDGIEFARDAWENKAPDAYGVVELGAENLTFYADNIPLDEAWQITVHVYAIGDSDAWPRLVAEKLAEVAETLDITWRVTGREFLFDIGKVHWTWTVVRWGPLTWEAGA